MQHVTNKTMEKDRVKELAARYAMSNRSVLNHEEKAEKVGVAVPWDFPNDLLTWYESAYGRQPSTKLRERVRDMAPRASDEAPVAEVVSTVQRDRLEVLEELSEQLGIAGTMARVVEEEERAYSAYEVAKASGLGIDAARRAWMQSTEAKRAMHKTDDAMNLAVGLLKEWVRLEWEPHQRKIREELSGARLGLDLRRELLGADEAEWVKIWNKGIEAVLVKIEIGRKKDHE